MKRPMATVVTILTCVFCCNAQKHYVGTDIISGLCFETLQLRISHGFATHWSAGADVGINMNYIIKTDNKLTQAHEEALKDNNTVPDSRRIFREICIHVEYWPGSLYRGPLVSLGGQIRDNEDPDMTIGVGYSIRIAKGLGADIMYRCGIIEASSIGKLPSDGIKAGIYYVF